VLKSLKGVVIATGSEIWESQIKRNFSLHSLNPSVRGRRLQLSDLRQWMLMGDEQFMLRLL
jgi:hypothetical protein